VKYVTNYKREGGKTIKDNSRSAQTEQRDGATQTGGQPPSKANDSENRNKETK